MPSNHTNHTKQKSTPFNHNYQGYHANDQTHHQPLHPSATASWVDSLRLKIGLRSNPLVDRLYRFPTSKSSHSWGIRFHLSGSFNPIVSFKKQVFLWFFPIKKPPFCAQNDVPSLTGPGRSTRTRTAHLPEVFPQSLPGLQQFVLEALFQGPEVATQLLGPTRDPPVDQQGTSKLRGVG